MKNSLRIFSVTALKMLVELVNRFLARRRYGWWKMVDYTLNKTPIRLRDCHVKYVVLLGHSDLAK